jgi:hypothetical protein
LRRVAGFENTVRFGDRLHVTLPRDGFAPADALERIRAAGVEIEDWRVGEPSLEDVFLAYMRPGNTSGP